MIGSHELPGLSETYGYFIHIARAELNMELWNKNYR